MAKIKGLRYLAIIMAFTFLLVHPAALPGELAHEGVLAYGSDPSSYNYPSWIADSPDATSLAQYWGVNKIEAPQAWQLTQKGKTITVAVLDTGISEDNQNLADKLVASVNFADSPTTDDLYGHGTHMAGIIAAVAPQCQLMNVKVAGDTGRVQSAAVVKGIIWATDHGAQVINLSLCTEPSADLEEAINYAWNHGVIVVAAAGNEGRSTPSYPAGYANCLAVAAIAANNSLALLSNHGDWVDMAAPGSHIYSTLPDDQFGYKSGTSPAAAHLSGAVALVFSVAEDTNGNGLTNDEARQATESTCSSIPTEGTGRGCVNAFDAVIYISTSLDSLD